MRQYIGLIAPSVLFQSQLGDPRIAIPTFSHSQSVSSTASEDEEQALYTHVLSKDVLQALTEIIKVPEFSPSRV
jgi:hypothetical protein